MADDTDDALKKHRDLLIACGWGKEVDVNLLLQQGASVRVQDQDGKNCLHYSSCKGHIRVTNLLIEKGCSINARDKGERTPLHLAAEEGHHDIVSILLDNNADCNVQDEDGNTPCHVASLNDHFEVAELLVHIKADLSMKNKDGFTSLHVATVNHHTKSMALLMSAGVNKVAQDMCGNTAVHLAAQIKSTKALKCLLKNGVDVNIQNHDGNTALHLGADIGHAQIVECILSADQPVELSPNNVGDTAKDIAISHGYRDIVQLIPDPSKKKKVKRRNRSSEIPTSPTTSQIAAIDINENNTNPLNLYKHASQESPTTFLQHPSEEITSATSSLLSLWVPTTDSGISLPMDIKGDRVHSFSATTRRKKYKQPSEKLTLISDLQHFDTHHFETKEERKQRHVRKSKVKTHEYEELRLDPRFMSPHMIPKRAKATKDKFDGRYADQFIDSGAVSDESIQVKGCFQSKSKKLSRCSSMKLRHKLQNTETEKELMMQKQAELQYQLNSSKMSLEKQMRKMRRKFEKALQVTDERFIEQKKREEAYHNQLKNELEIIEKSLERGSKRNVEEFSQHIKTELNKLAEKLTKGVDDGDGSMIDTPIKKLNKRASAVNLEQDISVSLAANNQSPPRVRNKEIENNKDHEKITRLNKSHGSPNKQTINAYHQHIKENEQLRARVQELEKMVKDERSKAKVQR